MYVQCFPLQVPNVLVVSTSVPTACGGLHDHTETSERSAWHMLWQQLFLQHSTADLRGKYIARKMLANKSGGRTCDACWNRMKKNLVHKLFTVCTQLLCYFLQLVWIAHMKDVQKGTQLSKPTASRRSWIVTLEENLDVVEDDLGRCLILCSQVVTPCKRARSANMCGAVGTTVLTRMHNMFLFSTVDRMFRPAVGG